MNWISIQQAGSANSKLTSVKVGKKTGLEDGRFLFSQLGLVVHDGALHTSNAVALGIENHNGGRY